MRSIQYMTIAMSALAFFDGAAAQRGGKGRGRGGKAQVPSASAAKAPVSSAVAAGVAAASSVAAKAKGAATPSAAAGAAKKPAPLPPADARGATLDPKLIASASKSDGNPKNGQAPSLIDDFSFINFCSGQTITNGLQNIKGSCNPIPMGSIPAKANMISTILTNPKNGETLEANTPFKIQLTTTNLVAGQFTNPNVTYYAAPQHLLDGKIIGHVHVTVQDMGDNTVPVDPTKFAFFKGIDDAGDGKGHLQANVTAGVPAGNYRICTMVAAANHQPVMMPVAQRGAQDDCIRITVKGGAKAAPAASSATKAAATASASASAKVARRQSGRFIEREFIV